MHLGRGGGGAVWIVVLLALQTKKTSSKTQHLQIATSCLERYISELVLTCQGSLKGIFYHSQSPNFP